MTQKLRVFRRVKFAGLFQSAGAFAVNAYFSPAVSAEDSGFRCVQ